MFSLPNSELHNTAKDLRTWEVHWGRSVEAAGKRRLSTKAGRELTALQLCEESGKKRKHVVLENYSSVRRKNSSVNQLGEKCPKGNVKSTAFSPYMGQTV